MQSDSPIEMVADMLINHLHTPASVSWLAKGDNQVHIHDTMTGLIGKCAVMK